MAQLSDALLQKVSQVPQIKPANIIGNLALGQKVGQELDINDQKIQNNNQLFDINNYKLKQAESDYITGQEDRAEEIETQKDLAEINYNNPGWQDKVEIVALRRAKSPEDIIAIKKFRADTEKDSVELEKLRVGLDKAKVEYKKASLPDKSDFGQTGKQGINPDTGKIDQFVTDKGGNIKWLGVGAKPETKKNAYSPKKFEMDGVLSKIDSDESLSGLPEGDKTIIAKEVVRRSKEYIDDGMDGVQAEQQAYDEIMTQYIDPANSGRRFVPFDSKDAELKKVSNVEYSTKEDVRDAYRSGTISKDEARQIIQSGFSGTQ